MAISVARIDMTSPAVNDRPEVRIIFIIDTSEVAVVDVRSHLVQLGSLIVHLN